jgi:hypothetical protein
MLYLFVLLHVSFFFASFVAFHLCPLMLIPMDGVGAPHTGGKRMLTKDVQVLLQDCRAYVTTMHWHIAKEIFHPGGCHLQVTDGSRTTMISISSRGKVALQGKDHGLYQQIQRDLTPRICGQSATSQRQERHSYKAEDFKVDGAVAHLLRQRHLTLCHPRPSLPPCVFQPRPLNEQTQAAFFTFFGDYAFRQVLYRFSSHTRCCREELRRVCTSEEQAETYLDFLAHYGFIVPDGPCWRESTGGKKSIGITLEWFIRELFQRQFHGVAQDGVYLAELGEAAGDLDVVAFLGEQRYIAVEAKASLVLSEKCLQRVVQRFQRSQADLSILYLDTHSALFPVITLLNRWLSSPLSWHSTACCYGGRCGSGRIAVINAEPTLERAFAAALQWDQPHEQML